MRLSLHKVGLTGWHDYFLDLVQAILKADSLDPFLRYLLVLKTLEFASLGDSFLEQELEPVLAILNDDSLDRSVPWIDPYDKNAKVARQRSKELLMNVPALEPLFKLATERQNQLENALFAVKFPVGWLEKNRQGEWQCRTIWMPTDEYILKVVSRADSNGQCVWQPLGHVEHSDLKIDSTVAQAAGEGSMVFATRAAGETKTVQRP